MSEFKNVTRLALRDLVDKVWNEATESEQVPDTRWADLIIDRWSEARPKTTSGAPWQPIETCPEQTTVLLFAPFSHPDADQHKDWKMGIGHKLSSSYPLYENEVLWCWGFQTLKTWDAQPTHWMPLPEPPK